MCMAELLAICPAVTSMHAWGIQYLSTFHVNLVDIGINAAYKMCRAELLAVCPAVISVC